MAAKAERLGLLSTIITFLLAGVAFGLGRWSGGAAPMVAALYLGIAVLVAAVSFFHLRLVRREVAEELEEAEFREENDNSLFTASEDNMEAFTAAHARRQFERFIVPGFTIILSILHIVFAVWLIHRLGDFTGVPIEKSTSTAAILASLAFLLFVGGKIQAAMAQERDYRLLLAPAGYELLCAAVCLLGAASSVAVYFKYPLGDRIAAWTGIAVMLLLGVEYLVTFILEIYRPRTVAEARPLYQSRITELLAQPRGLFESIAQAVDYQFGFQVSETWFYQLLQRAVIPLLAVQLLSLYLLSCFAFVGPDEVGICEHFGRPNISHELHSGVHLKYPWPIDKVYKFPAKRILSITLGQEAGEEENSDKVELWTQSHGDVNYWLVASREEAEARAEESGVKQDVFGVDSNQPAATGGGKAASGTASTEDVAVPVNLVAMHAVVQYRITDIYRYAYGFSDANKLISDLAYRDTVERFVSVDMFALMGPERNSIADELRRRLQKRVDALNIGVQITFFGIENIHPPVPVAESFENVVGATEEKESSILDAEAYANKSVPLANATAAQTIATATGYRANRIAVAKAEADAFSDQLSAYSRSPQVYRMRSFLDAEERAFKSIRKYIITAKFSHDVTILNLEDKLRPDLLDLSLPSPTKQSKEESH